MSEVTRDKIKTGFPIFKWVFSGVAISVVFVVGFYIAFKQQSIEIQHQIQIQQLKDEAQDKDIKALADALKNLADEQKKTTEAINKLNVSMLDHSHKVTTMIHATQKANQLLESKITSHISRKGH